MNVIKRDGREVPFNKENVSCAVQKAFDQLGKHDEGIEISEKIAREIGGLDRKSVSVEEIQDLVEKKLMASSHKDVAKAYINYRQLRNMARSQYQELMDAVAGKLEAKNVVNQNANVDEKSFGGRVGEASSVVTRRYALEYIVSPMAKKNHEENRIYIHDLDAYAIGSHNCLSIPFDDLLANGFNTRQADVRPAQSVNTAFQLVAVIFQLQSLQQFGGVSATHIDHTMVPYVRKSFRKHWNDGVNHIGKALYPAERWEEETRDLPIDEYPDVDDYAEVYRYALDMTNKEVYQAVEAMYHNLK